MLQKFDLRIFRSDSPIKSQHRVSPKQPQINWLTVLLYYLMKMIKPVRCRQPVDLGDFLSDFHEDDMKGNLRNLNDCMASGRFD